MSYEQLRTARVQQNHEKMVSLGLIKPDGTPAVVLRRPKPAAPPASPAASGDTAPPQAAATAKRVLSSPKVVPDKRLMFSNIGPNAPLHPCNDSTLTSSSSFQGELDSSVVEVEQEDQFQAYMRTMRMGHAVLLHGMGSKAFVLHRFLQYAQSSCRQDVSDWYFIRGYAPHPFDLHALLDSMLDKWAGSSSSSSTGEGGSGPRTLYAKTQLLISRSKQTSRKVLWVVPSLDGDCLRPHQDTLALLVRECGGNIYLICSADHARSAAVITPTRYSSLVTYVVHTHAPYVLETKAFTNCRVKEGVSAAAVAPVAAEAGAPAPAAASSSSRKEVSLESLRYVLKCVPQTHVKVFHELARHGEMRFDALFDFCRTKLMFAANNRHRLDQLIKEFVDQNVITRRTPRNGGAGGADLLVVNCTKETLAAVLSSPV